ncbi:MAG TPA: triose-phosphate isomerase family protein [Candidatus Babeliales bacterium]|jgi:triosephosphate isomerase|nr:triose-phosphate isomerase family protein [Candidatus Babeliales bacterium]
MKQWIYIANWKMNVTPKMAIGWYANIDDIQNTIKDYQAYCIICPSFVCIPLLSHHISPDTICLGGQDCSIYASGAYTGEVDAYSLQQVGCHYCIVGHYERRSLFGETDADVTQKIQNLYAANIIPIVCIGTVQKELATIYTLLSHQLHFLSLVPAGASLYIAYEPVYAIGTNNIPLTPELKEIFDWLRRYVAHQAPTIQVYFIYGGSVHPNTIGELKSIPGIDGFLIGSASNSWVSLKKIIIG